MLSFSPNCYVLHLLEMKEEHLGAVYQIRMWGRVVESEVANSERKDRKMDV